MAEISHPSTHGSYLESGWLQFGSEDLCLWLWWFEWEWTPQAHSYIWSLFCSWWSYLERNDGVALLEEVYPRGATPGSFPLCLMAVMQSCKFSATALAPCLPAYSHASHKSWAPLPFEPPSPKLNAFILEIVLVMVFCHGNRKVTKVVTPCLPTVQLYPDICNV